MSPRILVIDDDPMLTDIVGKTLAMEGHTIEVAHNGLDGIQKALDTRPDLIILDAMMPGMDGFEALGRMRNLDALAVTPIVMLSARSEIENKVMGFRGGLDDYIVKPFNSTELKLRVNAHIRRHHLSSENDRYVLPGRAARTAIALPSTRNGTTRQIYLVTKRIFDFTVSLLALPFAGPLMVLIALAIMLESPGNPVFIQQRTGMDGKRFAMFKFRTMVTNAEELKEKYRHLNELTWPDFKITNDPRMTKVGKFLRRTSLDELPQLINILKGDMSFVGPRPTSFKADTYQLWQTERLEVRPGLTGLWQVRGRADVDFVERVELDIEYIERQSWLLDLDILWHTFAAVLGGEGAH